VVAARMGRAYHGESALAAEAELTTLAAELDRTHAGAAASLREGMAEASSRRLPALRRRSTLAAAAVGRPKRCGSTRTQPSEGYQIWVVCRCSRSGPGRTLDRQPRRSVARSRR
jgi:hypothetical protein